MAHAKVVNDEAKILKQCSEGRRIRNLAVVPVILAKDRGAIDSDSHILATLIDGETSANVPVFTAPCACKIVRLFANAVTFPATSGAATLTWYKANIGAGDTALNTALSIDAPTDETAVDATLSTTAGVLDLIEGQLVYCTIALSATSTARSDGLVLCAEWIPFEQ
jgi:hypothetical protein